MQNGRVTWKVTLLNRLAAPLQPTSERARKEWSSRQIARDFPSSPRSFAPSAHPFRAFPNPTTNDGIDDALQRPPAPRQSLNHEVLTRPLHSAEALVGPALQARGHLVRQRRRLPPARPEVREQTPLSTERCESSDLKHPIGRSWTPTVPCGLDTDFFC